MHHIGVFYTQIQIQIQMLCQITNINNIIFHAAAIRQCYVVCSRHHIVECGKMRVNANRVLFHVHFFLLVQGRIRGRIRGRIDF